MGTSDNLTKWCVQWEMDGLQWDVLSVDMFENGVPIGDEMKSGTWLECMKFIYDHLLAPSYTAKGIKIYCTEGTYKLNQQDIVQMLKNFYPEEFI